MHLSQAPKNVDHRLTSELFSIIFLYAFYVAVVDKSGAHATVRILAG